MGKKIKRITQGGFFKRKNIEYELSYDIFVKELLNGDEFWFKYQDNSIDIAHYPKENKANDMVYHISINYVNDLKCENGEHQFFDTPEELLEKGRIDGKTIKEIWDELEN